MVTKCKLRRSRNLLGELDDGSLTSEPLGTIQEGGWRFSRDCAKLNKGVMLDTADWSDILEVLHETFQIWSPGLDRQTYYHYIWRQVSHPWARKHYRFLVYRQGGKPVASLKLYSVDLIRRSSVYHFAGLGALYTQESFRSLGYASRLLAETIERSRSDGCAGLVLFSDIGPNFYGKFGFQALGCNDFLVSMPDAPAEKLPSLPEPELASFLALQPQVCPVELEHIDWLERHYRQWLRRQPFGFARSDQYWSFKLSRELYLNQESRWSWPRIEVVSVGSGPLDAGYALIEYSARTLRILEIIGPEASRTLAWQNLFSLALKRGARRIRAWEGLYPEGARHLKLSPREWGCPMILPLRKEVESWVDIRPCPILELDYL